MKIGIASCYRHHNYGSMLQAYATQRAVEKLGYAAETIQYENPKTYMTQSNMQYYFHKITDVSIMNEKVRLAKSCYVAKHKYPEIIEGIMTRERRFDEFSDTRFTLGSPNKTRADLMEHSVKYDAVIVGSDQLWNPRNVDQDFFTLTFVPDEVKKISYATSIGTTIIPKRQIRTYKNFLNRFFAISVREQSALQVLRMLGIGNGNIVLDPTLLSTATEWMEIQEENPVYEGKYILCYFLGANQKQRVFANKLREHTGYQIVALQHLDEFIEQDVGFADVALFDIGPAEFVNLVRNAQYVCTDSFHGTCFSILNHKSFFTFNRFDDNDRLSTNTRIDSLLSLVGLEERRVKCESLFATYDFDKPIDYAKVDELLAVEREKSMEFLQNALQS